jgi:CRISPR-associated exonuclease Cas4
MLPLVPAEDDTILISALEHYSYCPRQCALIHREQTYDENIYTLRGSAIHQRVDEPEGAVTKGIQVERGLPLWSASLRLTGKADLVEFHGATPYPVEYKHGPSRRGRHADLQLCAQAMCLEEMLGVPVPKGAVYHFSSRQRREVILTQDLRQRVMDALDAVRTILSSDTLPPAVADARCKNCSLVESCLPYVMAGQARLSTLQRQLFTPAILKEVSSGP